MNNAASFSWLICRSSAENRLPTGLVIPARKRGFCRNRAASNVEPARGRPEMKWMPFCTPLEPAGRMLPYPQLYRLKPAGQAGAERQTLALPLRGLASHGGSRNRRLTIGIARHRVTRDDSQCLSGRSGARYIKEGDSMKHRLLAGTSLLALLAWDPAARAVPFDFTYTGSLVTFTVATTDTYQILAFGAQGGSGGSGAGGRGAEIGGDFNLTAGEVLQIAVGGAGSNQLYG